MDYDDVILNQSVVTLQAKSWTIESVRSFSSDMGGTIELDTHNWDYIKISHCTKRENRWNFTYEQNYCLLNVHRWFELSTEDYLLRYWTIQYDSSEVYWWTEFYATTLFDGQLINLDQYRQPTHRSIWSLDSTIRRQQLLIDASTVRSRAESVRLRHPSTDLNV